MKHHKRILHDDFMLLLSIESKKNCKFSKFQNICCYAKWLNPGQLGFGSSRPESIRPGQLGRVNSACLT